MQSESKPTSSARTWAGVLLVSVILMGLIGVAGWQEFSPQAQACRAARTDWMRMMQGVAPDPVHVVTTANGAVIEDDYRYPAATLTLSQADELEKAAEARWQSNNCSGSINPWKH